jgi:hypothetical protein
MGRLGDKKKAIFFPSRKPAIFLQQKKACPESSEQAFFQHLEISLYSSA